MNVRIGRRGTAAQNSAFTGAAGEYTYDSTLKTIRVHDAETPGGIPLATKADVGISWASAASNLSDNTASINAAFALGSGEVVIPAGTWRCDTAIRVPPGKAIRLDKSATLSRMSAYSASTEPVLCVLGSYTQASGGTLETQNAHPDGILVPGHETLFDEVNALYWNVSDMRLRGVKASGNRAIKIVNSQINVGANFANYFGTLRDIQVFQTDVGLELLEICNAHQFFNIQFWRCMTAAYRLRGAYENSFFGGFVHACDAGIECIQLLNRTGGPHDSDGNQFIGVGLEPATGGSDEKSVRIEDDCAANRIIAFGNVAGSNVILNNDNFIDLAFGSVRFRRAQTVEMGGLLTHGTNRQSSGLSKTARGTVGENATLSLFSITGTRAVVVRVDVVLQNTVTARALVVSETYSLRRPSGSGDFVAVLLSGGQQANSVADRFEWLISGATATGVLKTHNNGTSTTNTYRVSVEIINQDDPIDVTSLDMLV